MPQLFTYYSEVPYTLAKKSLLSYLLIYQYKQAGQFHFVSL